MATIGTLTRDEDGIFEGSIKTLSLNTKVRFVPAPASDSVKVRICAPTRATTASSSGLPGPSAPRRGRGLIIRPSSTTPRSRPRSMPAWSRPPSPTPTAWSEAADPTAEALRRKGGAPFLTHSSLPEATTGAGRLQNGGFPAGKRDSCRSRGTVERQQPTLVGHTVSCSLSPDDLPRCSSGPAGL